MINMEVIGKIIGLVVIILLIGLVLALPTMWLWNWLMPEIFELTKINFWQALGLNTLAAILFKNTSTSDK